MRREEEESVEPASRVVMSGRLEQSRAAALDVGMRC